MGTGKSLMSFGKDSVNIIMLASFDKDTPVKYSLWQLAVTIERFDQCMHDCIQFCTAASCVGNSGMFDELIKQLLL